MVLDQPHDLPDGTAIEVVPADLVPREETPPARSAKSVLVALEATPPLDFEPGELERLLAEVQEMREEDVRTEIASGKWGPPRT